MAIFPNLRLRRINLRHVQIIILEILPCIHPKGTSCGAPVVIISAFLDLEKNISFSDSLLAISALIYVLLAHLLAKNWIALQPDYLSTLRNALYIVSIAEILIIHLFRKWMLATHSDSRAFESALVTKHHPTPGLGKYTTVSIVSWAIADSIAIYGLLLFLLGGSFQDLYLFVAVALAVIIFYRPKMSELEELASAMMDTAETYPSSA